MLGTIVNTVSIAAGTLLGTVMQRGIKSTIQDNLFNAMGLICLALGVNCFVVNFSKTEYPILCTLSLALGAVIGSLLDISGRVNRFAVRHNSETLIGGITSASLLYCIGTFSIVGPILSAVNGDNTFLYTNATLDFVTSTIFAATYGLGMIWSALILCCWQSMFWIVAKVANDASIMQSGLLNDLSSVGGVLIISSGLSILKIKDCKTINLLPSLLVIVLWYVLKNLFQ